MGRVEGLILCQQVVICRDIAKKIFIFDFDLVWRMQLMIIKG